MKRPIAEYPSLEGNSTVVLVCDPTQDAYWLGYRLRAKAMPGGRLWRLTKTSAFAHYAEARIRGRTLRTFDGEKVVCG